MQSFNRLGLIVLVCILSVSFLPPANAAGLEKEKSKKMEKTMFILYVADQTKSSEFYKAVLQKKPVLDVPGMSEFSLADGVSLGLMPNEGIAGLLGNKVPHPKTGTGIPRCELYLFVADPKGALQRLSDAGGKVIGPAEKRPWGDIVSYGADLDGHILAFAKRAID